MPCRKGSGNEPTTAGVRALAGGEVGPHAVAAVDGGVVARRHPVDPALAAGLAAQEGADRRAALDLRLAHGDGPEVAGDGDLDGSLVAGLAHAAAGQQQRGAEEAASCVRQRGRNATGRYIRLVTVNLTRIYTRLGDGGETHLGDMSRVPKTHPRIEAYGAIDELNALVGLALTAEGLPERYAEWLRRVQNDLFDLGADLSVPEGGERKRLRVAPEQVTWLEQACDEVNATLEPLKSFVLPGGSVAAAHLHVCRTVCRRAERRALVVRGRQPRGRALPQPPLRPALHPQPRGQRGRRAAVGAGAVSHVGTGHPPRPPIAMRPLDEGAMAAARARQAQLVKPPGSLGRLEDLAVWLAGVTGSERPVLQARVVVAAADHGVAAQGVSAYPQAVTAQMLATFASGRGAVSTLAGAVGADLVLVDAGVAGGSEGIDVRAPRPAPEPRPVGAGRAGGGRGGAGGRRRARPGRARGRRRDHRAGGRRDGHRQHDARRPAWPRC